MESPNSNGQVASVAWRLEDPRLARGILAVSLVVGAVLRLWVVFNDDGIYWPDEIYQSFEPAHRLVFGYGLVPWEFIDGARSWALPGAIAGLLKVATWVGASGPAGYIHLVKVVFALLSVVCALGSARLAKAFGATPLESALAGSVWALCVDALYFAPRAMSENAAAVATVWGLAWALDKSSTRARFIAGASLLGLAVLFRLHMSVCCVGFLLVLAGRREWRRLVLGSGVLAVWAVIFGALDALTWRDAPGALYGGWFHSAIVYYRFNVIEGKAAGWGVSPWYFYFTFLWRSMPALTVAFGLGIVLSFRRAFGLVLIGGLFFALHVWSPHKEFRFLVPLLPMVSALVGIGSGVLPFALLRRGFTLAVMVATMVSAARFRTLTFGDLGSYMDRPASSAWDDYGHVNRLMMEAGKHEDLCGLVIGVAHLAWTGGSTYLHRNVPIYMGAIPVESGYFNYAIVFPGSGAEVVAQDTGLELVRIPGVQCRKDEAYSWRLP